jgi:PGF-pre-PGF domain-containing protein
MKTQTITIAVLTLLFLSTPVFAIGSISITKPVIIPSSVNVGDSFRITISVSSSSATSASGTLTLPSGLSCTPTGSQSISLGGDGSGSATWSCIANTAGDYTSKITVSISATDSGTGASLSDSAQTGLRVLSPASLTVSSTLASTSITTAGSATFTVGINNAGDVSTTYSVSVSCPSGATCTAATATSGTIPGNSLANVQYTVSSSTAGTYNFGATVTGNGQTLSAPTQTLTVTAAATTSTTSAAGSAAVSSNVTSTASATSTSSATTATTTTTPLTTAPLPPAGVQSTVTSTINSPAGGIALVIIPDVNSKVQEIDIKSKNAISGSLNISQVLQPSSTLTNAYLYFQVSETNFTDNDVSNATIDFKVEKSWLNQYNITSDKIALYRFNIIWSSLPTTQLSNDSTYVYYSAASPGLSLFAIAVQQSVFFPALSSWVYYLIGAVVVIGIIVTILQVQKRKQFNKLKKKWS